MSTREGTVKDFRSANGKIGLAARQLSPACRAKVAWHGMAWHGMACYYGNAIHPQLGNPVMRGPADWPDWEAAWQPGCQSLVGR